MASSSGGRLGGRHYVDSDFASVRWLPVGVDATGAAVLFAGGGQLAIGEVGTLLGFRSLTPGPGLPLGRPGVLLLGAGLPHRRPIAKISRLGTALLVDPGLPEDRPCDQGEQEDSAYDDGDDCDRAHFSSCDLVLVILYRLPLPAQRRANRPRRADVS